MRRPSPTLTRFEFESLTPAGRHMMRRHDSDRDFHCSESHCSDCACWRTEIIMPVTVLEL